MHSASDRTLLAAGLILGYAMIIGFIDNYVRYIAEEAGLWQFHAIRMVMAVGVLAVAAVPLTLRLRPINRRAVAARSALHATAMLIYFGALAFLPVAIVAAGQFTAPMFVLLISAMIYGERIGPLRIAAVLLGFAGVVMLLGPEAMRGASLPALLPVLTGALYAMSNVATRKWCEGESAETLVGGFFLALGLIGLIGMLMLWWFPMEVPAGVEGFLQRGPVWPSGRFYFWTFVQAAGSLLAVGMMVRAYQLADATRVSVFEYMILPAAAFWGWLIWGQVLTTAALVGMAMIIAAGLMIAAGARVSA